jgi:hypothetical protein
MDRSVGLLSAGSRDRRGCVEIIFRSGGGAIAFGALPGSSNHKFISTQGKPIKRSLLVPNAHFTSNLKLALG